MRTNESKTGSTNERPFSNRFNIFISYPIKPNVVRTSSDWVICPIFFLLALFEASKCIFRILLSEVHDLETINKIVIDKNNTNWQLWIYFEPGCRSTSYQDIVCIIVDTYLFLAVSTVLDRFVESKISRPFGSASKIRRPHKLDVRMPYRLSEKYFCPLKV